MTPYDALYLELALRTQCPLASLDRQKLEAAARFGHRLRVNRDETTG